MQSLYERGIELGDDRIPDGEGTTLNFRHLLERHALAEAIFADVNATLADRGTRYRGPVRNRTQPFTRFARGNLLLTRQRLTA